MDEVKEGICAPVSFKGACVENAGGVVGYSPACGNHPRNPNAVGGGGGGGAAAGQPKFFCCHYPN